MKNTKRIIEGSILDRIANSNMSDSQKISFLRYVGYMTQKEKRELSLII